MFDGSSFQHHSSIGDKPFPLRLAPKFAAVVVATFVGPSGGAAPVTTVPDLSGSWGRNSIDYEWIPSDTSAPVVNTVRLASGTRSLAVLVGDHTNPILQPGAAEAVRRSGELARQGVVSPDTHNQCWPKSPPYILRVLEIQIVQRSDQLLILYRDDREIRRIRLNQGHPTSTQRSWYGDSVGHWEGNTLVVDTVGIRVGPYSVIDQFGTPNSEDLHLVERYRLIDGDAARAVMERNERENGRIGPNGGGADIDPNSRGPGLQVEFTVEDSNVFTRPWSGTVTYRRTASPWVERVCAENLRESNGEDRKVPMAATPDF